MGLEILESFLRNDLTLAERKLDTFRFTSALLHQTVISDPKPSEGGVDEDDHDIG